MRISDWSSDVCSSDLAGLLLPASGLLACSTPSDAAGEPAKSPTGQDELTRYQDVTHYNNFYEFGPGTADPARNAGSMRTAPWTITGRGEVGNHGECSVAELQHGRTP